MPDSNSKSEPDETITSYERYRLVRSQIEHEDNLVTQRLNWFLASQSFLFSAYAISLNGPDSLNQDPRHRLMLAMVPLIAISTATLVFFTVIAGVIAMRHLHHWLKRHVPDPAVGWLPPVQGAVYTRALGMSAPVLLPPVFVIVWVCLMLVARF